jgi:hypothetical protein
MSLISTFTEIQPQMENESEAQSTFLAGRQTLIKTTFKSDGRTTKRLSGYLFVQRYGQHLMLGMEQSMAVTITRMVNLKSRWKSKALFAAYYKNGQFVLEQQNAEVLNILCRATY